MAGSFELVDAPDGGYRIRLLDGAGSLMAVSVTFPTKGAAVAGIAQAREIAGTGLVRDRSSGAAAARPAAPKLSRRTVGRTGPGASVAGAVPAGKRARAHH